MKVVVAYSTGDVAGNGTAAKLAELIKCRSIEVERASSACSSSISNVEVVMVGFDEDVLYFNFLDKVLDADYYIVVSRHSAVSGIRSLTVHHTGNLTARAEYGGRPRELAIANPPIALSILKSLSELSRIVGIGDVEITYEVTHHGPTELSKPLTFAEIGSSPAEWTRTAYQEILATAVYRAITEEPLTCIPSIGIGGGHYAHYFTQRALSLNECFGHIISKYVVKELRESPEYFEVALRQAVLKSVVPTRRMVLERKIPSYVKQIARSVASSYGIELVE